MKLLIITSVSQFKEQIQKILKNSDIFKYSYSEVVGHQDIKSFADPGNWFVGDKFESQSITFFAFVPESNVDKVFKEVELFNGNLESLSQIHISILNIEKTN